MIGDGGRIELGQDFTGHQRARQTMRRLKHVLLGICVLAAGVVRGTAGADLSETLLPAGAKAVWDLDKAFRETTYSRERICINGLWQWQPSSAEHARRGDATECRPDVVLRHQQRWLSAFYLDQPEEWDGPYRFFNW
jgi:hypothetical protein